MASLADVAGMNTGPSKVDKLKEARKAFDTVTTLTQNELPGVPVVVVLDDAVLGDVEPLCNKLYKWAASQPADKLNIADEETFVGLAVAVYGDNDIVRKAAKAAWTNQGA